MRGVVSPREYWDSILDPFGHVRLTRASVPEAWKVALEAQRTPDFLFTVQLLGDIEGKQVLELGSGLGCETLRLGLAGARVIGLDFSEERSRFASRLCREHHPEAAVSFEVGDAREIPAKNGSFDRIVGRDILMYADPARVLEECSRVLRPGGRAVFNEALGGNPLVRAYRRLTSSPQRLQMTNHLDDEQLISLGGHGLVLGEHRWFYVVSVVAFFALFILRSEKLHRFLLRSLMPLDRILTERFTGSRRWAWRGVVSYARE